MPKQLHFNWLFRLFSKGANRDTDPELTGASQENPTYFDSYNGRTTSVEGGEGSAWKKINGEELVYPNTDNQCQTGSGAPLANTYTCLYSGNFFLSQDYIIEIWADSNKVLPTLIRINGVIVLKTSEFPITVDFPPQCVINESCIGGEIYITDFNSPPLIFNLKDLMVNGGMLPDDDGNIICTDKYFGSFILGEYVLELNLPNDHPVFVQIAQAASPPIPNNATTRNYIFGAGGLDVGVYQYAIRYIAANGDKTKFTVATPLIPIVQSLSNASSQYPYIKTFGEDPGITSIYGIHIRFRITNLINYDEIEIKRVKYNTGAALGTAGIEEVLSDKIAIEHGEISIANVFDRGAVTLPITEEEAESSFSAIAAAKTPRYFDNRLFLMNIKYATRDINTITFEQSAQGNKMYPVIQKIYKAGHNDPYNFAYYKSYPRGEKFGFAVVGFDGLGEKSFAQAIPGFENYQFPNRREEVSIDTGAVSDDGTVRAATVNGTVSQTHEVFDLVNAVQKTDKCSFKNIMQAGSNCAQAAMKLKNRLSITGCADPPPPAVNNCGGADYVFSSSVGYQPYRPINMIDSDTTGHNYQVNLKVWTGNYLPDYNPKGFAPDYYSMGIALHRVTNIPSHIQSFSVVRSKPAKRVVCQGLGYYSILEAGGWFQELTNKNLNELLFFSQDVEDGIVDMTEIINGLASGRYKLQLVAPLGYFSEIYEGNKYGFPGVGTICSGIDFISYCRIIKDKVGSFSELNPLEHTNMGIVDGTDHYVAYGHWRGYTPSLNPFAGNANGNQLFDITSITTINEGRGVYFKIETVQSIYYVYSPSTGNDDFDDEGVKQWQEPVYIVNIIDTTADVVTSNIDEYLETGHFQKVTAIIGQSNGLMSQSYDLVDERWEDCVMTDPLEDKVIYVRRSNSTTDEAWLDITLKVNPNVIIAAIDAGTHFVTINGNNTKIYGVYKSSTTTPAYASTYNPDTLVRDHKILFSTSYNPGGYSNSLFIPPADSLIKVKYNYYYPIKVFGGDANIGESIFAPIDKLYGDNGEPIDDNNRFRASVGFPYRIYHVNPRVYLIDRTTGVNKIADNNEIDFKTFGINNSRIRQLICMFASENRSNLPYAFNDEAGVLSYDRYFPLVHYIMRPHRWVAGTPSTQNIFAQYQTDYPQEETAWGYGGFRFLPQTNIDYSKDPETQKHSTKPKVGFSEKTHFCSRIIWSDTRATNLIDDPGVRTFPALNFFDISDDTGEIKFAWSNMLDKRGSNLYAITEKGICLLMTNKRSLHELTGGQLAVMGTDETNVVLEQVWITKVIGMNDEMWRSKGEWDNILFFTNKQSVYFFDGANIPDILKESNYFSRVNKKFLQKLHSGYIDTVSGVYDTKHNEYWVGMKLGNRSFEIIPDEFGTGSIQLYTPYINPNVTANEVIYLTGTLNYLFVNLPATQLPIGQSFYVCLNTNATTNFFYAGVILQFTETSGQCIKITRTGTSTWIKEVVATVPESPSAVFAYSVKDKAWMGSYDYSFDKYVSFKNRTFGSKEVETYELDKGFTINGNNINGKVIQSFSPDTFWGKEFIRTRINSNVQPRWIKIYYTKDQIEGDLPVAIIDGSSLNAIRNRDGFEQYIPRETASPYKRVQGRMIFVQIEHDSAEEFRITDTGVQWKRLK